MRVTWNRLSVFIFLHQCPECPFSVLEVCKPTNMSNGSFRAHNLATICLHEVEMFVKVVHIELGLFLRDCFKI